MISFRSDNVYGTQWHEKFHSLFSIVSIIGLMLVQSERYIFQIFLWWIPSSVTGLVYYAPAAASVHSCFIMLSIQRIIVFLRFVAWTYNHWREGKIDGKQKNKWYQSDNDWCGYTVGHPPAIQGPLVEVVIVAISRKVRDIMESIIPTSISFWTLASFTAKHSRSSDAVKSPNARRAVSPAGTTHSPICSQNAASCVEQLLSKVLIQDHGPVGP